MADKILKIQAFPSGATLIASEVGDTIGLEIGSNCIFLEARDMFEFIRFIKNIDLHFLEKG